MTNLFDAHKQWLERPPDERFPDLQSLYDFTRNRQKVSLQRIEPLNELHISVTKDGAIGLNGNTPPMCFTNWAFGQLASTIGAPAKYLRTLPPEMVRDCLMHSLGRSPDRGKILMRLQSPTNEAVSPSMVAAFTGPDYGRIWDVEVVGSLMRAIEGTSWHVPPAHPSRGSAHAGLYASDRDMFAFLVNDEHPIEIGNAKLGKGFFLWNSETGASSFGLTTFLYNFTCGNHVVWCAEQVQDLRIIHRLNARSRYTKEATSILNEFVTDTTPTNSVRSTVERAMEHRIGTGLEDVLKWFAPKPFTKREVMSGFQSGQAEGDDVTTVWGIVQGLTAHARNLTHIDARVDLERRAGTLLN
jgi:hypothetical protein